MYSSREARLYCSTEKSLGFTVTKDYFSFLLNVYGCRRCLHSTHLCQGWDADGNSIWWGQQQLCHREGDLVNCTMALHASACKWHMSLLLIHYLPGQITRSQLNAEGSEYFHPSMHLEEENPKFWWTSVMATIIGIKKENRTHPNFVRTPVSHTINMNQIPKYPSAVQ